MHNLDEKFKNKNYVTFDMFFQVMAEIYLNIKGMEDV